MTTTTRCHKWCHRIDGWHVHHDGGRIHWCEDWAGFTTAVGRGDVRGVTRTTHKVGDYGWTDEYRTEARA